MQMTKIIKEKKLRVKQSSESVYLYERFLFPFYCD